MGVVRSIAVLTSGGDSPGMNAAIRAVVRTGLTYGLTMYGVQNGYQGLCDNLIKRMQRWDVSDVLNQGGTFLGSARYPAFKEEAVRNKAILNLQQHQIDALVVIGGDGSYRGAQSLTKLGYPCVGLPGTIDNDIPGTDYTIGFDTALNTITEAIDRLRDTSSSHQRISIIEVMGRDCGDLTLMAALAGGAEFFITPETGFHEEKLLYKIKQGLERGKRHALIVITENLTDIFALAKRIERETQHETRATSLGHVQRGGRPTAADRVLASRMGRYAVQMLIEGKGGVGVGIRKDDLIATPFDTIFDTVKTPMSEVLFEVARDLF